MHRRRHAPAARRNREPILQTLQAYLQPGHKILEIASGSGEHACYFCQQRPDIFWQPSDPDPSARDSIRSWREHYQLTNLADPLDLNVLADWELGLFDGIVCINMIHISPWEASIALLRHSSRHLKEGGFLFLYGPFLEADKETAESNLAFDSSLKERNPAWGLRSKEAIIAEAEVFGLQFTKRWSMPANNISLLFHWQP